MGAAGCEAVQSAIDSAEQKVLDYYGKPSSPQLMEAAFSAIRDAGLVVNTQVIVGAPVETLGDIWRSLRFGRRWADVFTISTLEPRPGTAFWEQAGRDVFEDFGKGVSLLHPHPRLVEASVIANYLLFYLHPRTLWGAAFGPPGLRRQLRWHMLMYSTTMLQKLAGAVPPRRRRDDSPSPAE
jgi:hypothetical protein